MKNVVKVLRVMKIIIRIVMTVVTLLMVINLFWRLDFFPMGILSIGNNIFTLVKFFYQQGVR